MRKPPANPPAARTAAPLRMAASLALLLAAAAAVFLGLAQLFGVGRAGRPQPSAAPPSQSASALRTPFAPRAAAPDAELEAAVAGLRLAGVRVAPDASQSGAVIVLEGGQQRAFAAGAEVAPGLRLAAISIEGVTLAGAGRQWRLPLESAAAPATLSAKARPAAPPPSADATAAWLARVLARRPEELAADGGWRVVEPLPEVAAAAGLRAGDVIVTVNGVGPSGGAALLTAARAPVLRLSVRRASGQIVTLALAHEQRT